MRYWGTCLCRLFARLWIGLAFVLVRQVTTITDLLPYEGFADAVEGNMNLCFTICFQKNICTSGKRRRREHQNLTPLRKREKSRWNFSDTSSATRLVATISTSGIWQCQTTTKLESWCHSTGHPGNVDVFIDKIFSTYLRTWGKTTSGLTATILVFPV